MKIVTDKMRFSTKGFDQVIDLTQEITDILERSKLNSGTLVAFVPGSTAALTTIEYESGVVQDIRELIKKLIPADQEYHHNAAWQDGNGHAHIRAAFIGPSLSVPFINGKLTLGTWQQIVFLDFDIHEREREIIIQIIGE
jgi:secondary thiamine-phosphate synthase enzyme